MLNKNACAVAVALALVASGASAGNVSASMTVLQSDGASWVENLSGLLAVDAQNNFSMVQGTGTTGFYQNGAFVSAADATVHADYWQWTAATVDSAGSWGWHSAQTLNGSTPATTDASNPWQSGVKLQDAAGHGDPDMIYAVSAINNTDLTQTYSFTFGEAIAPIVSGDNSTYADMAGALTSRSTSGAGASITPVNSSGIQRFELSADNGSSFVNAGVDVGQAVTIGSGTSALGTVSATNPNGPSGQSWNYMRLLSSFTLSAKSAASLTGFASITPVPEPSTGLMLLSGLGMFGTMLLRRRHGTSK